MTPPEIAAAVATPTPDRERQWLRALDFYRTHDQVLFLGEGSQPAQQALSRTLSEHGVKARWIDCAKFFPRWAAKRAARKGSPLIWVQGGISERLAKSLPYISVFSVLDDIFAHDPQGVLAERAHVITTQNSCALARYHRSHREKTKMLFPADEIRSQDIGQISAPTPPPANFPRQVMGHIGPITHNRFDFALLESFVEALPTWGFVLAGPTDDGCEKFLERLKKRPNFWYAGNPSRAQTLPLWRLLTVALLLYKDIPTAEGAFPFAALEATHFGVPCVLTKTKVCADLTDLFPHGKVGSLKDLALERANMDRRVVLEKHALLAQRMSPKGYLTKIAALLAIPTPEKSTET